MRGKLLIVFILLMVGTSVNSVYGYTGKGTSNNPYEVSREWELKEVLTRKSNGNSWVYVAINDGITITSTIQINTGKFRVFAKGGEKTIRRSSSLNADVNDSKDPKYCMKVMGTTQLVLGYKRNGHILKIGGNKNNISEVNKTSGWLNIESSAIVTIGEEGHVLNVRNNENSDYGAPIRTAGKVIVNGEISNCIGVNGGAIKVLSGEVIINSKAKIHNCESQTEGGAIHISSGGKITMNGGHIYECMSAEEGGAIFINGNSRGEIISGKIQANISGQSAGGIFSGYGSTLIIGTTSGTGPEIYYNRAAGSGGGVRCNGGVTETAGGTTYFYGGTISNNYSGKNGGGISCGAPGSKGSSKIILQNVYVVNNVCEETGGGIWLPDKAKGINTDYVILDRCAINSNESKQGTGGIMIHCSVNATNNYISNNKCESYGGGIFIDGGGCLILQSGTITGNRSNQKGQGIYVQGEFKIYADAYVSSDNEVYLTRGTYIEVIGKLNKTSGYIAVIDSAVKTNGTKLVKAGYTDTDAIKELYYKGTPADEYVPKEVIKKYTCCKLKDNQCLRPSNDVSGYDDSWIIISEKYTVSFEKNCGDVANNIPDNQIKFWNEDIKISTDEITRTGYKTDKRKHWNVNSDGKGTSIAPGSVYSLNGDRTLYAVWIRDGILELFVTAEDRYYAVGQKIELNNAEIFRKVSVEDDLKTGKKYEIKLIQISKEPGDKIVKGDELSAEEYLNTSKSGSYKATIYVKDGDIEASTTFRINILDTFLQNGKTRFISSEYISTIPEMSKWRIRFYTRLKLILNKKKGEGNYTVYLTNEKVEQIKQKVRSNNYIINQAMNRELAESW